MYILLCWIWGRLYHVCACSILFPFSRSKLERFSNFFFKGCKTILGFWAGHHNCKVKKVLTQTWQKTLCLSLEQLVSWCTRKYYCKASFVCLKGSQPNSALTFESIHYGCVPSKPLLSQTLGKVINFFQMVCKTL